MSRPVTDRDLLAERYRQRFSEDPPEGDWQARRTGVDLESENGTRRMPRAPRLDELDKR